MSRTHLRRSATLAAGLIALTVACAPPAASEARSVGGEARTMNTEIDRRADEPRDPASQQTKRAEEVAQIDGIDFEPRITTTERAGDRRLRVEYKLTNRTGAPLLVFDQGDTDKPGKDGAIYVDPQPDGVVEISRRGWKAPTEPSPTNVVYPGATLLAPGASASGSFELTIAYLVARRPYGSMTPGAAMPRPVRRVRFCLGVAGAEGVETRTVGEGARRILVPSYAAIERQRLVCSPVVDLG